MLSFGLLFDCVSCACNYGVFGFYPLADGECSSCDGDDCGSFSSLAVSCSDNGDNATLNFYSDTDCTTEYIASDLDTFECSNSGSCSTGILTVGDYDDSDCGGSADSEFEFVVAQVSFCDGDGTEYDFIGSSIKIGGYSSASCSGTASVTISLSNGCNNGTYINFDSADDFSTTDSNEFSTSDSSDSDDTSGCNSINNYYVLMKIIGLSISIASLGITVF